MNKDFFSHKAKEYDSDGKRVENVDNIANAIIRTVDLNSEVHIMDFGSGTGLLLERIASHVAAITAIDVSSSMNQELLKKQPNLPCTLHVKRIDLEVEELQEKFNGVISSMTLHHIQDIEAIFSKLHSCLHDGGFLAIADLDAEDGSFHTEDTGVHHFGFDRSELVEVARKAGFKDVNIVDASTVVKPHGEYSVFLLAAKK